MEQVRREFLVALDERRQPADELARDLGQFLAYAASTASFGVRFVGRSFSVTVMLMNSVSVSVSVS